jgi:6-phosphogluconolactonase
MIEVASHTYPDRDTLARSLAELVAAQLRAAQGSHRGATLAVPGGATPGAFLRSLGEADLDWAGVAVLPTDERLVAPGDRRENARLLREALLVGPASAARLVPLTGEDAAAAVEALLPIDVLVLGMGADLHTASLFPGAPGLAEALAPDAPALVELAPPTEPERRVSLSARALRGAGVIHLLIAGREKAAALHRALEDGPVADAPVRAVLTAPCPVSVHYAD